MSTRDENRASRRLRSKVVSPRRMRRVVWRNTTSGECRVDWNAKGNGVRMSLKIASESRSKRSRQDASQARPIQGEDALVIQTSRFGPMTVDAQRIMTFERGLLGFPNFRRYALIQTGQENCFFWLQSVDEPTLAFVVTDPSLFFKEYRVPFKEEAQSELELGDAAQGQVFVICNKVDDMLTCNLLGPIVVNVSNRRAQQVVLTEKRWTTRQPLVQLTSSPLPLAKSA
jgi:flagellar assembly factor FliW